MMIGPLVRGLLLAVTILAAPTVAAGAAAVEPSATGSPGAAHGGTAGELAAERGWWGAARRAWATEAARDGADGGADGGAGNPASAAARLAQLDATEAAIVRGAEARAVAAAGRWERDRSPAWRTAPVPRPESAGITVAAGLVLWNSGRALHGVAVADGRPPWPADAADRDTTIFPRGLPAAGRDPPASASTVPPPCVVGDRGYAVLALADGSERLVCVDLSNAAEGRLVWAVDAAAIMPAVALAERRAGRTAAGVSTTTAGGFDGQPMADHELCLVVVRPVPDRGARLLAAFVAADGRLAWVRPAGPARTSAGDDLAPGRRRPCLAEDRIVLVTHAGVIIAFDRDGAAAWTTTTPAAAATAAAETAAVRAASPLPATDVVFAGGRVVAAPRDAAGIVALDPWTGAIAWQWSRADETVEQLLGACGDGVLVATAAGDGRARLWRLATADGREAATRAAAPPDGPGRRRAGNGVVVDATVLWPLDGEGSSAGAATTAPVLEVLDGRSLERRREPLPLPFGEGGPVALGVAAGRDGGDSLACAAGTAIIRLAPGPRAAAAP